MSSSTNAYEQLGVPSSASDADIRRAYRKLALRLHPDKNPDNPDAAAEFAELQRAYALLCDDEARAALDAWLDIERQKEERGKQRSEKRRRMAEDLEMREMRGMHGMRASSAGDDVQSREAEVRLKLQRQIDRLKRQAAERQWMAMRAREQGVVEADDNGDNDDDNDDDNEKDDEYLKPLDVRLFPAGAAQPMQSVDSIDPTDSIDPSKRASAAQSEREMKVLGAMMGAR